MYQLFPALEAAALIVSPLLALVALGLIMSALHEREHHRARRLHCNN